MSQSIKKGILNWVRENRRIIGKAEVTVALEHDESLKRNIEDFEKNAPSWRTAIGPLIGDAISDTREEIEKYNPISLLCIAFTIRSEKPSEYRRDRDNPLSSQFIVDYLAALMVRSCAKPLSSITLAGFNEIIQALQDLGDLFAANIWLTEDAGEWDPDIDFMARRAAIQTLFTRGPGVPSHQIRLLRQIFSPVEADIKLEAGFGVEAVIATFEAIPKLMQEQLIYSRAIAFPDMRPLMFSEFSSCPWLDSALVQFLAQQPTWKERWLGWWRQRLSVNGERLRFMNCLGPAFELKPSLLACRAGFPQDQVERILEFFTCTPRAELTDATAVIQELGTSPVWSFNGRFYVPNPDLLIWSIQPRLQSLLEKRRDESRLNAARNQLGDSKGGAFVEACHRLMVKLLGNPASSSGVLVPKPSGGARDTDIDLLYLFDRTLFHIQVKAAAITPGAWQGRRVKVRDSKLVKAMEQVAKAEYFLLGHPRITVRESNGSRKEITRDDYDRTIPMIVSGDSIDAFIAPSPPDRLELNLPAIVPWVVSLQHLCIVADLCRAPWEFHHYALQRLAGCRSNRITAFDETDWFGYYQRHTLTPVLNSSSPTWIPASSDEINHCYLAENGWKLGKISPPRSVIADWILRLVETLDDSAARNRTMAIALVLDLDMKTRDGLCRELDDLQQQNGFISIRLGEDGAQLGMTICVCAEPMPSMMRVFFVQEAKRRSVISKCTGWVLVEFWTGASRCEFFKR